LSFKKDGDAFEKLTFYWLQMRIKVAVETKHYSKITIRDLFCINPKNKDVNNDLEKVLNTIVKLPKTFNTDGFFFEKLLYLN
jgi:hypothetical protein